MKKPTFTPVFVGSSLFIYFILLCSLFARDSFFRFLSWARNTFVLNVSWFYVLVIFLLFLVCLYLIFGRYGNIRLGKDQNARPRYNFATWLSMLFSAGMGTGLLFSGVYEPLTHYFYPPVGQGGTPEAVDLSFRLTFLHWGFSGWAVYAFVGLAMAYLCFHKGLAFRFSSMLYPVFKKQVGGKLGDLIDVLAIAAILFGVATSLGRGALQINGGLHELFGLPVSALMQGLVIAVITGLATASVLSGLDRGIRRLSELNIVLCLFLIGFVLFLGPTSFLLNSLVEYTGAYLQNLIASMTWLQTLGDTQWRSSWTILYWAWWIAWAPFVGSFIARISEGRTIREFVAGALFVPVMLTFLWFMVFGGTAIHYHVKDVMDLQPFLKTEYALVVFKFFEHFPFAQAVSLITVIAIVIFFVTSSDSASYVVDQIARGRSQPSPGQKIYWAVLEGAVAALLLFTGGVKSLELFVIVVTFPLSLILLFVCYNFFQSLRLAEKPA